MGTRMGFRPRSKSVSSPPIIAIVGGLNMDLVFQTERMPLLGESIDTDSLEFLPGGKGANTAMATYRASRNKPASDYKPAFDYSTDRSYKINNNDIQVFMNGAVGKDDHGKQLRERLKETGIDVTGVRELTGEKTGTCAVFVETKSAESRNLAFQGANLKFEPSNPDSIECLAGKTGKKPDLIVAHLGVSRDVVEPLLEIASKSSVDTILNPSPADYLLSATYPNITHLILNEQETAELQDLKVDDLRDPKVRKNCAHNFITYGVKNVVITLGSEGAYYKTEDGDQGHVKAEKNIHVKDTTGAGDSFIGAYAVDYIRQKQQGEWNIERAVSFACKAAAHTIEQLGAQEALPWLDEIKRE